MDSKNRFKKIKKHFEKEAAGFDALFFKVMPRYEEMMQAVVDSLPYHRRERLKIIDLGCGTGNLSRRIISSYPNAHITCIDMAENMLKMAQAKLKDHRNAAFWLGDVRDYSYKDKYDAIVASMVLHHVEGKDKPKFYRKLYRSLASGGVFLCIDIFLSSNAHVQKLSMDTWKKFMKSNGLPMKKINNMISRHQREDRPVVLEEELAIMRKAGFTCAEVILKHYNFAVYGGVK